MFLNCPVLLGTKGSFEGPGDDRWKSKPWTFREWLSGRLHVGDRKLVSVDDREFKERKAQQQ